MRSLLPKAPSTCAGLLVLATLSAVGCGGGTGTVTGKVTYNGNPLKGGEVWYVSEASKQTLSAQIGEDGTYTVNQVPVGPAKIVVKTKQLLVQAYAGPPAGRGGAGKGKEPKHTNEGGYEKPSNEDAKRKFVAIPTRYEDAETSGLTYTVRRGSQNNDVKLEGNLDWSGTPSGLGGGSGPGGAKGGSGSGPPKK